MAERNKSIQKKVSEPVVGTSSGSWHDADHQVFPNHGLRTGFWMKTRVEQSSSSIHVQGVDMKQSALGK